MIGDSLKDKKLLVRQLIPFGFQKEGATYRFSQPIVNGQFRVEITVGKTKKVSVKVFDHELNEEYLLYSVLSVQGALVGKVRQEADLIIQKFIRDCFEVEIYQQENSKNLIAYALEKYGDKPEYLWEKFPQYSIIRKSKNQKWYCLVGTVEKNKIGLEGKDLIEIANFKIVPENLSEMLKKDGYFPAYHMNKKTWMTVLLDGTVPFSEIQRLLDASYELA